MRKIFLCTFRLLFGIYLIFWGLRGLSFVNEDKTQLLSNLDQMEKKFVRGDASLKIIKQHSVEILYYQNLTVIYGGFLLMFGLRLSKAFVTVGMLIHFIFVNNIYFSNNHSSRTTFSYLLSILTGVYYI